MFKLLSFAAGEGDMADIARRILVVDDEDDVRTLVRRLLEKGGYVVETVSNGGAALESTAARRPDLIVLDLGMPVLDGWAVIERLRHNAPPPIVVLASPGGSKGGPLRSYIAACIDKPIQTDELAAACRRILTAPPLSVSGSDRRQEPRRQLIVKVVLLSREGNPILVGRLVDLSSHGLQMEMDTVLDRGDHVRILLHVPGAQPAVELEGYVLWRNPAAELGYAYGIDISRVTATAARMLQAVFE